MPSECVCHKRTKSVHVRVTGTGQKQWLQQCGSRKIAMMVCDDCWCRRRVVCVKFKCTGEDGASSTQKRVQHAAAMVVCSPRVRLVLVKAGCI